MLIIRNATIYTPDEVVSGGTVVVENGRFQSITPASQTPPPDATLIDADGLLLTPGFIDLQVNGGFGLDFTEDPATIWPVAARLPQFGVTSFLPTIITSPPAAIAQAQRVLQQRPAGFAGAEPLGLHVEGPYLNPAKKGAHNPQHLQSPLDADPGDWSPETGIALLTLAPELPGALALARTLAGRGVVVSAGHSMATFDEALAGFDAGIRYGTHLFNAMPPLHHRDPGLIGALLDDERAAIGLIPDGIHVHPALVRAVWQAAGTRLNLVTDAMAAMGTSPGVYRLGDFEVTVDETTARLPDGTLAGSIVTMDAALRNLIDFTGCTPAEALPTITTIPANLLSRGNQIGQITPGFPADCVLLTPDLTVVKTLAQGKIVYERKI